MIFFYIVATPIGNLRDITLRALDTLRSVDIILCEDTRVTKKLLVYYKINTKLISYHQHSSENKIKDILSLLAEGKKVALVCDSGTPGISDPGNLLVKSIIENFRDRVNIVPVVGPSAVTAAASVADFSMNNFLFLGFPPTKKKREKFFTEIATAKYPVIFYESSHRILKSLGQLSKTMMRLGQKNEDRQVMVCRELTKKFESIYRGNLLEILNRLKKGPLKGEFVIVVSPFRF